MLEQQVYLEYNFIIVIKSKNINFIVVLLKFCILIIVNTVFYRSTDISLTKSLFPLAMHVLKECITTNALNFRNKHILVRLEIYILYGTCS